MTEEESSLVATLKMELAKVGLCMVHGMSQGAQTEKKKSIDEYVERIKIIRDSDEDSIALEWAVIQLFEKNATQDPVRLAGIAMHMCDRLVQRASRLPSRMIRDASRCTESVELKSFLEMVADEVDRVGAPVITKEVEAHVDTLVELFDDDEPDGDMRTRTIETICTLLPDMHVPPSILCLLGE